jgi:hypothetical protein
MNDLLECAAASAVLGSYLGPRGSVQGIFQNIRHQGI